MNWGVLWYICFADWSVISPCTEAILTCVNFLVKTRSFTLYIYMFQYNFMANQNFAKTAGFRSAGHICYMHIIADLFYSLELFEKLDQSVKQVQ